jgi:hypothetical protein
MEHVMDTVPQPQYPLGTPFDELPDEIVRRCCSGKSCTTYLDRSAEAVLDSESPTGATVYYAYKRGNDDGFFVSSTVDGLIAQLNDPEYWPVNEDEDGA